MARRVLIGTPSYDGKPDARYVHSFGQTLRRCLPFGIDLRELIVCYDSIIQNSRNDIIHAAYKYGFDDLIWIDADQGWEAEWITRLLAYPVDCVGGTVRKKTDESELYNVRTTGGAKSLVAVPGMPGLLTSPDLTLATGFLRFSKRAVAALYESAPEYSVWGREKQRWVFEVRPVNGELVGEDTAVCVRLRELGIPTYLDPTMTCSHTGTKTWTGDFAAWLRKQGE